MAATTLHHRSLQLNVPAISEGSARQAQQQPEGQFVSQGQAATALSSPAAGNSPHVGSDRTSKAAAQAAELALKREDAELSQRVASERRNLPSNVEGFKYESLLFMSLSTVSRIVMGLFACSNSLLAAACTAHLTGIAVSHNVFIHSGRHAS